MPCLANSQRRTGSDGIGISGSVAVGTGSTAAPHGVHNATRRLLDVNAGAFFVAVDLGAEGEVEAVGKAICGDVRMRYGSGTTGGGGEACVRSFVAGRMPTKVAFSNKAVLSGEEAAAGGGGSVDEDDLARSDRLR